jgi:hypothetical protein
VLDEMEEVFNEEKEPTPRKQERLLDRETSYVGGYIPLAERVIPPYDALTDRHCTYVASRNFLSSPYMKFRRAADRAIKCVVTVYTSNHIGH